MQQILDALPQNPVVSGAVTSRIPIWFFHLRASDGSSIHSAFDIEPVLDVVNQQFNGIFEFTVCGNTTVNNDQFNIMHLAAPSTDFADLNAYVNSLYQPTIGHCIKVFLCDGLDSGAGGYSYPRYSDGENAAVFLVLETPNNLSHELGHYFGLPHTFIDPATQYVHDINHPIIINGNSLTCQQTGDGFCDTPADLETGCSVINCSLPAVNCPVLDPLGVPYSPDPTLLMSYYSDCSNRFSLEQNVRMLTLFDLHPAYEALKNVPVQCQNHTGRILKVCSNTGGQFPDPMEGLAVRLRQTNFCSTVTNGNGRYEINPCNSGNGKRDVLPELVAYSNPLNGVTSFDCVLINKHILGIEPFDSPFKMIAADANNNGMIQMSDILTIRKVILGVFSSFPYANWRYVPNLCLNTQAFSDAFFDGNPFDATFNDPFQSFNFPRQYLAPQGSPPIPNVFTWMDHVSIITDNPLAQLENTWSLSGVKVGDVNCNAINDNGIIEPVQPDAFFETSTGASLNIIKGEQKIVQVFAESEKEIAAWQLGLKSLDPNFHIKSILPGTLPTVFDEENFALSTSTNSTTEQILKSVWFSLDGTTIDINNQSLFGIEIEASENLFSIETILKISPEVLDLKFYDEGGDEVEVTLKIGLSNGSFAYNIKPGLIGQAHQKNIQDSFFTTPNPSDSYLDINYDLKFETEVVVSFYDSQGKFLFDKNLGSLIGINTVRVNEIASCNPGMLIYCIKAGEKQQFGKVIKK